MVFNNNILKFRSGGFVHLFLILVLALPLDFVFVVCSDYSGRLKIESVYCNKSKPFVGFHFLYCHLQMVENLKNKSGFNAQTREYNRNILLNYKNQKLNFLTIKNHLSKILHLILYDDYNEFNKLFLL